MSCALIPAAHATANIVDFLGLEAFLPSLGIAPVLVRAVENDISLFEVWAKPLYCVIPCRAVGNAEHKQLWRVCRGNAVTEILVVLLMNYLVLGTDVFGTLLQ